jgi:hypothetical protein
LRFRFSSEDGKNSFLTAKERVSEFVRRNGSWSFGSFVFLHVSCCALWVVTFNLLVSMYVCWRPPLFRPGISLSLSLSLYDWTFGRLYIPSGYNSHICMALPLGSQPSFFGWGILDK